MIVYPTVNRKLPELFELIIALDHKISSMKSKKIISLTEYSKIKQERLRYSWGAEDYIRRSKKDN